MGDDLCETTRRPPPVLRRVSIRRKIVPARLPLTAIPVRRKNGREPATRPPGCAAWRVAGAHRLADLVPEKGCEASSTRCGCVGSTCHVALRKDVQPGPNQNDSKAHLAARARRAASTTFPGRNSDRLQRPLNRWTNSYRSCSFARRACSEVLRSGQMRRSEGDANRTRGGEKSGLLVNFCASDRAA
jgi:hypothetical protein